MNVAGIENLTGNWTKAEITMLQGETLKVSLWRVG